MDYYKRHWSETTGDDITDSWGRSTFYFEIDHEYLPSRQIQVFANGKVLKYDSNYMNDEFGGLGDQPIAIEEFEEFKIDSAEFEKIWTTTKRYQND